MYLTLKGCSDEVKGVFIKRVKYRRGGGGKNQLKKSEKENWGFKTSGKGKKGGGGGGGRKPIERR